MERLYMTPPSQGQSRAHILCVDDDHQLVSVEKILLEYFGFNVTACTSGMEALETFRDQPDLVDLLISDLSMPQMSGLELAGEIRRLRPDLPIIFCSGDHDGIAEEVLDQFGVHTCLQKPIPAKDLARAAQQALEESPCTARA